MPVSKRMNSRLSKIDALIEKGYTLNSCFKGFYHQLRDEKNNKVNTFKRRSQGHSLPGFSWISFIFGPFVAVQIKHWSYFWFFGIACLIFNLVDICVLQFTGFDFGLFSFGFEVLSPLIYAINFPYQRWLFSKTNRREIAVWASVISGFLLILLARTPSIFLVSNFYKSPTNTSVEKASESYEKAPSIPITDGEGEQLGSIELNDPESIDLDILRKGVSSPNMRKDSISKNRNNCRNFIQAQGQEKICF